MQLDIFRGLAALLMILNHSGFAWLSASDSAASYTGALVFAGGWAPVLFFFATGLGMGYRGGRRSLDRTVFEKTAWLLLADIFLNWGMGDVLGFNFFGLTALAMLTVAVVRSFDKSLTVALSLIAVLLLARYVLGPVLKSVGDVPSWLGFLIGVGSPPGVSYPVSPWLVYPVAAWALMQVKFKFPEKWFVQYSKPIFIASGVLAVGSTMLLVGRGLPLFRWGVMSIAYFVQSIAALVLCWLIAGCLSAWVGRVASIASCVSLRGSASFLVVPLHYVAVAVLNIWWAHKMAPEIWLIVAPCFAIIVIMAAKIAARQIGRFPVISTHGGFSLAFGLVLLLVVLWCRIELVGLPLLFVAAVGQILVAFRLEARASQG